VTTPNDSISTHEQDSKWNGSRLIMVGAVCMAIALAIIYVLASTVSKMDLQSNASPPAVHTLA
jgi:hypothetical protein